MTVKILGLAKLDRKLKALPAASLVRIKAAMTEQADEIVAMMKSLVPVESGALRDSVGWTWGRAPKGAGVVATAAASLGGDLTITIYAGSAEAFYARWQEFGTAKMKASPYFYESWRAGRKGARRKVRAAVRDAARQVAG